MVTQIRSYLLFFTAVLFTTVFVNIVETQGAFAQGYGYSDFGSRPALSPWLGLSSRPTGSLDAYNQYVRPQLDMQRAFSMQQSQISRQGMVQQEMLRRSNPGVQSGGRIGTLRGVQTTGGYKPAATFRNYSHYYNFR